MEPRSSGSIIETRKRRALGERALNAPGLQIDEVAGQRLALWGQIEQALAAVGRAGTAVDEALVHQLAQHAPEALLGDAQDVEQVGHPHAGMTIDEVQHAVVGAAEAETLEDVVGVAHEIAIGEEQELDQVDHGLGTGASTGSRRVRRAARALRGGGVRLVEAVRGRDIYVSHVDFFRYDRYREVPQDERIVRQRRPTLSERGLPPRLLGGRR
jgi:hypothetical protein